MLRSLIASSVDIASLALQLVDERRFRYWVYATNEPPSATPVQRLPNARPERIVAIFSST
jgi:hypothetical protein